MTSNGYKAPFIGADPHGSEFENAKVLVILSYPHLAIEHRAFTIEFDPNGQYKKEGCQNDKSCT